MSESNPNKDNPDEENPNQDGSHHRHPSIYNQDNETSDRTLNQINQRQFRIPQRQIIRAPSLSSRGGRGAARGSGRGGRGNNSFNRGLSLLANVSKNITKKSPSNTGTSEAYNNANSAFASTTKSLSQLTNPQYDGYLGKSYNLYSSPQSSKSIEDESIINSFDLLTARQIGQMQHMSRESRNNNNPMLPALNYDNDKNMEKEMIQTVFKICNHYRNQSKRNHTMPDSDDLSSTSSSKKFRHDPFESHEYQKMNSFESNYGSRKYFDKNPRRSSRGYKKDFVVSFPKKHNSSYVPFPKKNTYMFSTERLQNCILIRQYSRHRIIRLKHYLGGIHSHKGIGNEIVREAIKMWQCFANPIDEWIMQQTTDSLTHSQITSFLFKLSISFNIESYPFEFDTLINGIYDINYCRFHGLEDKKVELRYRNDYLNETNWSDEVDDIASHVLNQEIPTVWNNTVAFSQKYPQEYKRMLSQMNRKFQKEQSNEIGFSVSTKPTIIVERNSTKDYFPLPPNQGIGNESINPDDNKESSNLTFTNTDDHYRSDIDEDNIPDMEIDESEYFADGNIEVHDNPQMQLDIDIKFQTNFLKGFYKDSFEKNSFHTYDFTASKDQHCTQFDIQSDVEKFPLMVPPVEEGQQEMLSLLCSYAYEPLRQVSERSFLYYGSMHIFVIDEIKDYWKKHVLSSQTIPEVTKYLYKEYFDVEARILLSKLFTNFQFDVAFYTLNNENERDKYPNILSQRVCVCPCSKMMSFWQSSANLEQLFKPIDSQYIINPRNFDCPTHRITCDEFMVHLNQKCNDGCHYHMAIRAYISTVHGFDFNKTVSENLTLNKTMLYNYSLSTFNILRKDNICYLFSMTNIFEFNNSHINNALKHFDIDYYLHLLKKYKVMNKATSNSSKKGLRKNSMILFGSSLGANTYPRFPHDDIGSGHSMLPYPVLNMRKETKFIHFLDTKWMKLLCVYAEDLTLQHLYQTMSSNKDNLFILKDLNFIKDKIHESLRINKTFFTQLVLVCIDNVNGEMPAHVDPDDLISCIFTFGELEDGGSTYYMDGLKSGKNVSTIFHGSIKHKIPFQHGRVQIGQFDSIIHGIEKWVGNRITFCFNVKKSIINHFYQFENNYYQQFVDSNYGLNDKKFVCDYISLNE